MEAPKKSVNLPPHATNIASVAQVSHNEPFRLQTHISVIPKRTDKILFPAPPVGTSIDSFVVILIAAVKDSLEESSEAAINRSDRETRL